MAKSNVTFTLITDAKAANPNAPLVGKAKYWSTNSCQNFQWVTTDKKTGVGKFSVMEGDQLTVSFPTEAADGKGVVYVRAEDNLVFTVPAGRQHNLGKFKYSEPATSTAAELTGLI